MPFRNIALVRMPFRKIVYHIVFVNIIQLAGYITPLLNKVRILRFPS